MFSLRKPSFSTNFLRLGISPQGTIQLMPRQVRWPLLHLVAGPKTVQLRPRSSAKPR
jgi:hypothetical protein